ncbi:MAG: hypothetical protein WCH34_08695 [Bacteroidota bacterium]
MKEYKPGKPLLISLIILLLLGNATYGQAIKDTAGIAKNTVYVELLGNGGLYSINYDRILFRIKRLRISAGIGISYIPPSIWYYKHFIFPIGINFIYGGTNNIEVGLRYNPVLNLYKYDIPTIYNFSFIPEININYRFQKLKGGFFFKMGLILFFDKNEYTTTFSNYSNNNIWLGLGIGYTFKNKRK